MGFAKGSGPVFFFSCLSEVTAVTAFALILFEYRRLLV